ncbi:MAG: cyclohexanecarboxylate-CoA ligase [Gammaproteobacteria bacterium]|nr:cyclohexanecarboxylate-CoA ligase [Gammaproteobacteria bacterium]
MTGSKLYHDGYKQLSDEEKGTYLGPERLARERELGFWPNRVLTDYFDDTLRQRPESLALAAYRMETGEEISLSYAQLNQRVHQIARQFMRLGINKGDVVAFQLPNCWQFVAIHLACIRIGAVSNPLMPIFRAREMEFMVNRAQAKLLVVPRCFRKFDHEALAKQLLDSCPKLQHLLVIDGEGEHAFAAWEQEDDAGAQLTTQLQPDDIAKIMFTSGTTGEPKGVMHSSNTLLSGIAAVQERLGLTGNEVIFMPSPFAHSIGFVYGIVMSTYLGVPLIMMDIWDPKKAVELMERYRVSFIFAAPPFLMDLINVPVLKQHDLSHFRLFMLSGGPIPRALVTEAKAILHASIATGWGMTETTLATCNSPAQEQHSVESDGIALPHAEVRVVDEHNNEVPRGAEGKLQYRGSSLFVGYFKRPDLYEVDQQGWFDTGDLARMNEAGYISIVARDKDIIIRGGENIPVVEVEALIYEMPQVREVALVGMPDLRLGERACAFVVLHPGKTMSLKEMTDYLSKRELARQYLPERLEIVHEVPKTPSGKVQKFVLRKMASADVECA